MIIRVVGTMQGKCITLHACGAFFPFFFNDCTAFVAMQVCCFLFWEGHTRLRCVKLRRPYSCAQKSQQGGDFEVFWEVWEIFVSLICSFLHSDRLNVNKFV